MLRSEGQSALPIYVNFKLSLRLEPLYVDTTNAAYWFQRWLIAKIYDASLETLALMDVAAPSGLDSPTRAEIRRYLERLEAGRIAATELTDAAFTVERLEEHLRTLVQYLGRTRCVLLLDDAAHAFAPKQQEDFFEFFRRIKSKDIAPKAAVYPGITSHSASFHVGHDAEQIDVWMRPDTPEYLGFMRSLATKRFGGTIPMALSQSTESIDFLAYAAFGVPRSFLNMIRSLHLEDAGETPIDRRRLLDAAKLSREAAHNVYESLNYKLPAYKSFVTNGDSIYANIIGLVKDFNRYRATHTHAVEIGLKRPLGAELIKVISFFQYAGLLMLVGENSRGVKGVFDLYMVHFGDLITENAIVGARTKSVTAFVRAFTSQSHQAWPRISSERLIAAEGGPTNFLLSLPNCQRCGAPRQNESARFCHSCGSELKTSSLYEQLVGQDISSLPITKARAASIRSSSNIRTVRDILIDSSRQELRNVPYVGPIWADRIVHYAEEHVA